MKLLSSIFSSCLLLLQLVSCGLDNNFTSQAIGPRSLAVDGCTLGMASNFNPLATEDNGTCEFNVCWDNQYKEFDLSQQKLIEDYLRRFERDPSKQLRSTCQNKLGCINSVASNRDPSAAAENGSCLFTACIDPSFQEYDQTKELNIKSYLQQWGELYQGKNRLTSSCQQQKIYCPHPEALNYTPGTTLGRPYCYFAACSSSQYQEHSKYLEYQEYLKTHPGELQGSTEAPYCQNKLGCINSLANNKDSTAKVENGSCLFTACFDPSFQEYDQTKELQIKSYLQLWGELYQGKNRLASSCQQQKIYCPHPEALNYTPGVTLGRPYCYFTACSSSDYQEFSKYLEYQEYLKTHPGELQGTADAAYCKNKKIVTEQKDLNIDKSTLKEGVTINIIIDDSTSMNDEVEKVSNALQKLAKPLVDFQSNITLEIHELDGVNNQLMLTPIPSRDRYYQGIYQRPLPMKKISMNKGAKIAEVKQSLDEGFDLVMEKSGSGNEMGLCYLQRLLKHEQTNPSGKKQHLINFLITDENSFQNRDGNHCDESLEGFYKDQNQQLFLPRAYFPYLDQSGKADIFNVLTDTYLDVATKQKLTFLGIYWDQKKSFCMSDEASDGAAYRDLITLLKQNGLSGQWGDVCESDYNDLIEKMLLSSILELIERRYQVAELSKNPVIKKVQLLKQQTVIKELSEGKDYQLKSEQQSLWIELSEAMLSDLKQASGLRIILEREP